MKENPVITSVSLIRTRAVLLTMSVSLAVLACSAQTIDPVETARETGRPALIYFSGSDWCANCKAFSRDVLSKPEMETAMAGGFVRYTADRPIRKPLDADTERLNASLVKRYNASNIFPLLVVVAADGRVLDRIPFERGLAADRYAGRLRKWSGMVP